MFRSVAASRRPGWWRIRLARLRLRARTVRSLLPFLERVGAVRGEEVDIDTLEDRCAPRSPARTACNCFRPLWGPGLAPDLSASPLHEWAVSPFFWPES